MTTRYWWSGRGHLFLSGYVDVEDGDDVRIAAETDARLVIEGIEDHDWTPVQAGANLISIDEWGPVAT